MEPTVKHGGGLVMFWFAELDTGCYEYGRGTMKSQDY